MYQRIFVIVLDSLGVGAMPDSKEYGDIGVDTFGHIGEKMGTMQIPNLQKLGMANSRKKSWQRYDDRTLGDDGAIYHKAFYYFYREWFPR